MKYDKLNDIWEWLGFIKKLFVVDEEFKCSLLRMEKRTFDSEFMNGKPKENEKSLPPNIQDETNLLEVINKIEEVSVPSKTKKKTLRGVNNREKIMP